ncbi:hypothetical protein [Streptomyces sp. NPDC057302]|uniref:hypothetical protein n=1 Tax=Streptomyces sp. NPDC057302 TaxID=3346094 RepID=UPI003625FEB5
MFSRQPSPHRVEGVLAHLRRHHARTYLWALLAAERGLRPGEITALRADDPLLTELGGYPFPPSPELLQALEDSAPDGVICRHGPSYVSQTFYLQSEHDGLAPLNLRHLRRHFLGNLNQAVLAGEMPADQAAAMARFKPRPLVRAIKTAAPEQ